MIRHVELNTRELRDKIKKKEVNFGGNSQLKIYGTLQCRSGKRMKKENRVFFVSENEAIAYGYRPCGHCMKEEFKTWKTAKEKK